MEIMALVETTQEVGWDGLGEGTHVVTMMHIYNGKPSGHSWVIFRGSKKQCKLIRDEINSGIKFFKLNE
jgi:hypothetical protein